MTMPRLQKTTFIAMYYDKIIVVVVLLSLVLSLGFLIGRSRSQRRNETRFNARIEALKPANPDAAVLGTEKFDLTVKTIEQPPVVNAQGLLVAAERVACVQCGWPIKLDAEICQYCNANQPSEEVSADWDSDGDGMPDVWETKYGLNPLDPSDASGDLDRDGFTNLEEFLAGTDPTDPKSHPPLIDFLRAEKIDAIRFPYVFKGKSRSGPDTYKFQINESARRTYFIELGEKIGKSAYKAVSFTNQMMKVTIPGIGGDRMREMTVLTVSNGEESLELIEGGGPVWYSFEVTLVCRKVRDMEPIIVKQRKSFTFDGERYTVIRLVKRGASEGGEVVIRHDATEKEISIPSL